VKPHTYNFNLKPIAGEVLAIYGMAMYQHNAAHWVCDWRMDPKLQWRYHEPKK
jgi:hypothetical protein